MLTDRQTDSGCVFVSPSLTVRWDALVFGGGLVKARGVLTIDSFLPSEARV